MQNSYDAILANDVKLKVAISSSRNGWIAIIKSKEVNDYAMLLQLSKEFQTEVLAVLQSDVVGAWGYIEMLEGKEKQNTILMMKQETCEKTAGPSIPMMPSAAIPK